MLTSSFSKYYLPVLFLGLFMFPPPLYYCFILFFHWLRRLDIYITRIYELDLFIIDRPHHWNVNDIVPTSKIILDGMSHCFLSPAPECSRDHNEWRRFLIYLQGRDMVKCYCFLFSFGCTDLITFIYFSSILVVFLVLKSKLVLLHSLHYILLRYYHLFIFQYNFFF